MDHHTQPRRRDILALKWYDYVGSVGFISFLILLTINAK